MKESIENNGTIPAESKEISIVEFVSALYPKYAEVGKPYIRKNEIVHKIVESETMLNIYTDSCGIKYGTPICVNKKDIVEITYKPVSHGFLTLSI